MNEWRELKVNLGWLGRHYRPHRRRLLQIVFQSVVTAALGTAIPLLYMRIVDGLTARLSLRYLAVSVGLVLLIGTLNFFVAAHTASLRALMNVTLEWGFRQRAFEHLIRLGQRFYRRYRTGDLVTRLTDDVGRKLAWFACSGVFRAWDSLLRVLFCLAAMFYLHPLLALIALAPLPIQVVVFVRSSGVLHHRFRHLQGVISRVNETIETCFSGIRVVQAYRMEERQAAKFLQAADDRAQAEVKAESVHAFVHNLYGYFWQFAQVLVLVAGGILVIRGRLTLGEFVAFDAYVGRLIWPMFDIGTLLAGYRRAAVSIARVREIESEQPEITARPNPLPMPAGDGRLVYDEVSFRLGERLILDRVSLDLGSSRMTAVVGAVGSGKTAVLNLAARFFDPESGCVRLDGTSLAELDPAELRGLVGYVSQEPLLFTDTVEGNIRFGRAGIPDERLLWAADLAQLAGDVAGFPRGYQTLVGLRGHTLSGGQKQRVAVARALAGRPRLLILDDATSALDADTEARLWNNLFEELPGVRCLLVTHRTATLEGADLILVMKDGRLVEQGRHEDLMERGGEYFRIYSRERLKEQAVEAAPAEAGPGPIRPAL